MQRGIEKETGKFTPRQLLYLELGYEAATLADDAALASMQLRLGTVSGLIAEFDQNTDTPSARQLELGDYLSGGEDADGVTAGQIFYASLVGEAEFLIYWIFGFMDGDVARAGRNGAPRKSSGRLRPNAAVAATGPG